MSRENKFKNKSNIELRAYVALTLQIEDVFGVQHVLVFDTTNMVKLNYIIFLNYY